MTCRRHRGESVQEIHPPAISRGSPTARLSVVRQMRATTNSVPALVSSADGTLRSHRHQCSEGINVDRRG